MMRQLVARFDAWLLYEYRAKPSDLAVARFIISIFLLSRLPIAEWVTTLPSQFFDPPLSIAALARTFPSSEAVATVNLVAAVASIALLLGYRTRIASVATTVTFIIAYSFAHSTGKIDHLILVVAAPALLSTSGWGAVWSLDASSGRERHFEHDRSTGRWNLAWLAVVIAVGLATSGVTKLYTGWLDFGLSSSYGQVLRGASYSQMPWLSTLTLRLVDSWLWELSDWLTVMVELAGLMAVWRVMWFRAWCLALAVFHLMVALHMNIWFSANLAAYAVFVPWGAILRLRLQPRMTQGLVRCVVGVVVAGMVSYALAVWFNVASDGTRIIHILLERFFVIVLPLIALWAWSADRRESGSKVMHDQADHILWP